MAGLAAAQWDARRNPLRSAGAASGNASTEIQGHLAWLNSNLARLDSANSSAGQARRPQSISLQAAVADGLSLPLVVEKLLDKPIEGLNRSPLTRAARLSNLDLCVSHLCRMGAAQPSSGAAEIMSGSLYQTLNLVRWVRSFCDARAAAAAAASSRQQSRSTVQQAKHQRQRQQQQKKQQQQQLPISKQPLSPGKAAPDAPLTRIDGIYQQQKEGSATADGSAQKPSQVRVINVQSAKPLARNSSADIRMLAPKPQSESSSVTVTEDDLRSSSKTVGLPTFAGNEKLEGLAKHAVPPLRVSVKADQAENPKTPPPPPAFETPVQLRTFNQSHHQQQQQRLQLDEEPSDAYQPKSPASGRANEAFQPESPSASAVKPLKSPAEVAVAAVAAANKAQFVSIGQIDDEEGTLAELDFSRPGSSELADNAKETTPAPNERPPPPPRPPPPRHPPPRPSPPRKSSKRRRRSRDHRHESTERRPGSSSKQSRDRRRRRPSIGGSSASENFDSEGDGLGDEQDDLSGSSSDSSEAVVRALEHRLRRLERHVTHLSQRLSQALSLMSPADPHQVQLDDLQQPSIRHQVNNSRLAESVANGDHADSLEQISHGVYAGSSWQRDWPPDRPGILGYMTHPLRHKKLSWFFGSEPPFLHQFLDYLGYGQYIRHFEQHNIGIRELVCLDDKGLRGIGLPKGPRARILQAVREHLPPVP